MRWQEFLLHRRILDLQRLDHSFGFRKVASSPFDCIADQQVIQGRAPNAQHGWDRPVARMLRQLNVKRCDGNRSRFKKWLQQAAFVKKGLCSAVQAATANFFPRELFGFHQQHGHTTFCRHRCERCASHPGSHNNDVPALFPGHGCREVGEAWKPLV